LLIIIGNPNILVKDPHWCAMLKYCIQHNAYTGCARPTSFTHEEEMDSVLSQFTELKIGVHEQEEEYNGAENGDPNWRNE